MNHRGINDEIKSKYQGLEFEEKGHKYKYKGNNLTPVSNVVEGFVEEFDLEFNARNVAERRGLHPDQVKEEWRINNKQACDFGTQVHNFAEKYVYHTYLAPTQDYSKHYFPTNGHELAVVKFWNQLSDRYMPVSLELQMFSETMFYAGTCDVLMFDSYSGGFVLLDYKTNKNLHKNFRGKTMLYPFEYLLDSPYNHYQIQLSLYQMLLEEKDYRIVDRIVLWLKDGEYEVYHTGDFTGMLKTVMS